ncbi:hypothetical protein GR247_39790 [Rhizobium leguminosarum]|uniref:hypothetical protein n=1 Tax=Rhizobium TaxID=379 RepID=UPI000FEC5ED3|nr:hypothetical protein [Rhizobium leguminosarum]NEJ26099.1 hypothetical protein [Rhizobium leguminosarum]QIO63403.1 hypothetical protein HA463_38020 [Rhizobium leguminosarum bv. trifolii]RWX21726.1 hypothetical protein EHH54_39830 [Rhizobium leguminosarum]
MSDNWRDGVRLHLEDFVDSFVVKGAKQSDVYDAIIEEIGNLQAVCERDSDPAEDLPGAEAEESSNDWPGALR